MFSGKISDRDREIIVDLASKTLWSREGLDAKDYMMIDRGVSEEVLKKFKIGYCPPHINHFLRNRIIIPIYDNYGNLKAMQSRVLRSKNFWHESFDKSFYIFGLYQSIQSIISNKKVIVVEGDFDALFLHSVGATMTTACLGTALGVYQLSMLSRYCSEIYFMPDGDKAGRQAIDRVSKMYIDNSLDVLGVSMYTVYLPDRQGEKDPDDFVKKNGINNFIELLKYAKEKWRVV